MFVVHLYPGNEPQTSNVQPVRLTPATVAQAHRGGSIEAFDLPLATMRSEKFNQPIFGANNLSGTTPPLAGSTGLADDINWKIAFNNGGAGTFLHIFFRLLVEMRQRMAAPAAEMVYEHNVQQNLPQAVVTQVVQAAFVDPSDPTKLYVPGQGGPVAQGTVVGTSA